MGRLIGLAALLSLGFLAWQVGNRLSTDSVGMAVGLVFGVLAGVPTALLVLATGGRTRQEDGDAWDDAYQAGIRDVTALALGTRPDGTQYTAWVDDGKFSGEWMDAMMKQRAAAQTVDGQVMPTRYSVARPFDIVPAQTHTPATRCAGWQHCPDCGLPLTPDEHCAEWCGVQP